MKMKKIFRVRVRVRVRVIQRIKGNSRVGAELGQG